MQKDGQFDVIVVGAGPIGAATARHLSEQGAAVLVVGPDEPSGFADHEGVWAGHYDQGRLAHVLEVPLMTSMLAMRSIRRFRELQERTGIHFATPSHSLTVMPDDTTGGESAEWFNRAVLAGNAADLDVRVDQLSAEQLRREYPELRFAPGHVGIVQRDAFIVNPRELVRAELAAALENGAVLIRDVVSGVERTGGGAIVSTRSGETWCAGQVVVATGAATNVSGLLDRPLDTRTYGATVVLVEVADPAEFDIPAMMYLKAAGGQVEFGGIVMSPLQYPDGRWYLKCSGRSLLDNPLESADAIARWVRTGGRQEDLRETLDLLTELLPGKTLGPAHTRPCMVCETPTGLPYIDRVDQHMIVAIEGERGAMAADEIGRLAAGLAINGGWTDGIPHAAFHARWAESERTRTTPAVASVTA
ncbi:FAD-binding oxidoreductase [Rhodococcus hoagii]|uniref:NAD(P)/FAD-dependent oxidoreductase n=1 Tax=Rhodococcus hoagii TaxID=43767 RepID=UPI000A0FEEB0|nr:FAD-dependent oxidoreductase [Prescottella equi]MBM9838142.1 FAD-binding oxidoreductase [Prescottella equi]NKS77797.1 FAD-dependent oxidoreductase [Prescottella equi]ORL28672.1 sarcosine oxidase [Prescottella equi]UNQ39071.1 FAD-binding oxidoreductase [Prescottella equi]